MQIIHDNLCSIKISLISTWGIKINKIIIFILTLCLTVSVLAVENDAFELSQALVNNHCSVNEKSLFTIDIIDDIHAKNVILISSVFELKILLKQANNLPAQTEIIFQPGTYQVSEPILIKNQSNLRIVGGAKVRFVGNGNPVKSKLSKSPCLENTDCSWSQGDGDWSPQYPNFFGFSVFQIVNSSNIQFSQIKIKDSWPNAIGIDNSQRVKIDQSQFIGGTNAVFAHGQRTEGIQILNSSWNQDPSKKIWSHYTWQHIHHGELNYLNGAFFQSRDIIGNVLIDNNSIANAFNGVRMKVGNELCQNNFCPFNSKVSITNNKFTRISDNVIEPEVYMRDWQVINNNIKDTHAAFSFDGVMGSNFNLSCNSITFNEKPRQHLSDKDISQLPPHDRSTHTGGCIFKLKKARGIEGFVVYKNMIDFNYQNSNYLPISLQKGVFPKNTLFSKNINSDGSPIVNINIKKTLK